MRHGAWFSPATVMAMMLALGAPPATAAAIMARRPRHGYRLGGRSPGDRAKKRWKRRRRARGGK